MAYFRCGISNIQKFRGDAVDVADLPAPIASFKSNVSGVNLAALKVLVEAVQSGSGTPSPDNVRPITGWSGANVTRTGKNLLDDSKDRFAFVSTMQEALINFRQYNKYATGYCNVTNGVMSNNATYTTYFVPCKPNTTYSLKCYTASAFTSVHTLDSNGNTLSKSSNWVISYTVTTENNASFLAFAYAGEGGATVEESSTPSAEYIPYLGNTYIIAFGDTYYGGELDVTNGVLRVTHKIESLTSSDYWAWNSALKGFRKTYSGLPLSPTDVCNMCELLPVARTTTEVGIYYHDSYVDFINLDQIGITDTNSWKSVLNSTGGVTFTIPLATPIEIQLTPQQIAQLLGDNNVFADCGDVEELKKIQISQIGG